MNLSDIRKQVIHLQRQRQQLELELIRFRSVMEKGSIFKVYRPCRKENCSRCNSDQMHGPYLYLNLRVEGRATQRYVGKESDKSIVKRVNAYTNYQQTLAHVRRITKQMDSLFNIYRDKLTRDTISNSKEKTH